MSRGRRPIHGSNAERQRAYRQRRAEAGGQAAAPAVVEQKPLNFITQEAPRAERREIVATPCSGPAVQPGGNVVAVVEEVAPPAIGGIEPGTTCRHELVLGLEVRVERALERARVEATVMRVGVSGLQQGWRYPFRVEHLSEVSG